MRVTQYMAVLAGVGTVLPWLPNARAGEIRWVDSYDSAKNTARERGALIMLDFTAEW